eukprot:TRINITY_DN22936_c0_g1_i1.p1 TRINITY_DN22936_c0_g1~~TRINITY_DN22936_c0_g1_i1.p1  ORF type:complete len:150 (-),score=24.82 TRINITY_DN22936_c0_g1_i1:43-450(-)
MCIRDRLEKHQLAVTSVDWKAMSKELGEVLVTCSDDQTFRVYQVDNDNINLLFVETTSFIKDWHTLTYLALEEGGENLGIGAQNGFFFLFNIPRRTFLFSNKIHLGGIEGLSYRNGKFAVCSSDNSISVISVKSS